MFKRSGRGAMKPFCINPDCKNFLPEEKRGYRKKPAAAESAEQAADEVNLPPEPAAAPDTETTKTAKKPAAEEDRCKKACCEENSERKNGSSQKDRDKKDEKNSGRRCRRSTQKERIAPEEEGRRNMMVTVIGAGLAGSEAAWQLAERGFAVRLCETKPSKMSPGAKTTARIFGGSWSARTLPRGDRLENAVGLSKRGTAQASEV